ncbi:MAG: type II toxin-antitoxin system ParD family antitoxin [Alphaproteobacteria bacterium]|nr:type II toxin-antitoxin system ParD family antitoxin [Alphaproteobacteria bacterium]
MAISADLGKVLEAYVCKLVEEGRYGSKSEVLREGVRLVQEREQRLAALDEMVAAGLKDVDEGRTIPAEEVFDRLEKKYREMAKKSKLSSS